MNMIIKSIKRFCSKVLNRIEERLANVAAGILILVVPGLCIIFWKWLKTKHSLAMYGFLWIAVPFVLICVPFFMFWLLKKKATILYREDNEILVVLENKLRGYEHQSQNEILIDFRSCDRKWGFPKGSAQRLLPSLVEKDRTWRIRSSGGNAMTIIREDPRVAVLRNLNKK